MKFLLISLLLFLPYEIVFGKPTDLFDDVQNTRLIALENDVFQAEVMEVSFLNEYCCQAQVPNPNSPEENPNPQNSRDSETWADTIMQWATTHNHPITFGDEGEL